MKYLLFFITLVVSLQSTRAQSPYKQSFGIRLELDSVAPLKMEYKRFFGSSNWSWGASVGLGHQSMGTEIAFLRHFPWLIRNIKVPGWRWVCGITLGSALPSLNPKSEAGYSYLSFPIGSDNIGLWQFKAGGVFIGNYWFYEPRWYGGRDLSGKNMEGIDWLHFSVGVRFILGKPHEQVPELIVE